MRIPCEIIGKRIIFLTKGNVSPYFIESRERGSVSEPLKAWNSSVWQNPVLKRISETFDTVLVREQAYQEFKHLLEDARANRDYLIVEANEFKRALFINHSAITKRDAEKVFKCKILERKRRKRTLWIFQPE